MKSRIKRNQLLLNRKLIGNNRKQIDVIKQQYGKGSLEFKAEKEMHRIDLEAVRLEETFGQTVRHSMDSDLQQILEIDRIAGG